LADPAVPHTTHLHRLRDDDDELRELGVDPRRLRSLARQLLHGDAAVNHANGLIEPPAPDDIAELPERGSEEARRLEQLGLEAMARGELAVIVLAGGMATRMGGVVKALVDAVPGVSFLEARLAERRHWAQRSGGRLPLWLMTSHATDEAIRATLPSAEGEDVAVFQQNASARLTPDGELFRDDRATSACTPRATATSPMPFARAGCWTRSSTAADGWSGSPISTTWARPSTRSSSAGISTTAIR